MSEKKFWQINDIALRWYPKCDESMEEDLAIDYECTIEATEEEVKELLEAEWNPKCIEDPFNGELHRHIEAVETRIKTIDDLKKVLSMRGYPVE